jgi:toxin FitB
MILLDTNILSAMMRDRRDLVIAPWLDTLPDQSVRTTAITHFEIRLGLETWPKAKGVADLRKISRDLGARIRRPGIVL